MQSSLPQTIDIDSFKQNLHNSLKKTTYKTIKIPKNTNIYVTGDNSNLVYVIENGIVKLLFLSPEGKECLLAIYSLGDIFGELAGERMEIAKTMTNSQLKGIPIAEFFEHLGKEDLLKGFVKYLALRVAQQQQVIASLATVDSEKRLGNTLLQLAENIGKKYPYGTVIEFKISHEELSKMIGATRPRTSMFMHKFRRLGLITLIEQHYISINEQTLSDYLTQNP